MATTDTTNPQFKLAAGFVNQTNQHVFLTGKAGTGKTTFLKYIQQTTFKKTVVVAPTGVAAINAAGVTMHSFFQLPFGAFIPVLQGGWNSNAVNKHTLFKNIKFGKAKIELLQELELLVIDEVSMVRADMLDAVDTILRHFRNRPNEAFGGLQVLFIGDLFQLPPVTNATDWELLQPHYKSPFFFDAQVLRETPPIYIELKKIYRQSEAGFINILNNVRNNTVTDTDLEALHKYYRPGYEPTKGEQYITLTSHNAKADAINQSQLQQLPGKAQLFNAFVKGDFSENAYPAEEQLQLKEGAQVMFIKNDKGENRRYYNGKIVTISRITDENIFVKFPGTEDELLLETETWHNIRYRYNQEKNEVAEEEIGSFEQYPIRLAWAITIHKSQGLTFEKAIIDAGASFAVGQVYVALSRLTSMHGMILRSRIGLASIQTDERILEFANREQHEAELSQLLEQQQEVFISRSLVKSFEWQKLTQAVQDFYYEFEHRLIPDKNEAAAWAGELAKQLIQQQAIATKFSTQLLQLQTTDAPNQKEQLHQRIVAAKDYFTPLLQTIITAVQAQIEIFTAKKTAKRSTKKYTKELRDLQLIIGIKLLQLQKSVAMAEGLAKGIDATALLEQVEKQTKNTAVLETPPPKEKTVKPPKGETKRISLALFKNDKLTIAEIAQQRGMVISTIAGHLATFVATGDLAVTELVAADKILVIEKALTENPGSTITAIKELLGPDYSYGDLKAVVAHQEWLEVGQSQ